MKERMYRAQILLDPDQRRRLEERARREGRSISAVTREAIDRGLDIMESQSDIWDRRNRILAAARERRDRQPFVYQGNLVEEVREERDQDMDRIWRQDT